MRINSKLAVKGIMGLVIVWILILLVYQLAILIFGLTPVYETA